MQRDEMLRAEETIEDLQLGGLRLIQNKTAFRYWMDTVLLADFSGIQARDRVCDMGTGNGVLPLLLYGRGKGAHYDAFEIIPEAAELAERNARLNGLEEVISVYRADAGDAAEYIAPGSIDAVVCNPPYSRPSAAITSPNERKAIARSQGENTLEHILKGAHRVLKGKGRLFLVYPAPQMLLMMKTLEAHHLEPKRFRMVYPYADKPANLVLIEAMKDAKAMLHPMPPLIIYRENGEFTDELKTIYHMAKETEEA